MTVQVDEIALALGDPVSDAWVEVHHTANVHRWGPEAERTTIAEVLDVADRRHEHRRTFVARLADAGADGANGDGADGAAGPVVGAAQTIRRERDNVETGGIWLSVHPDHQRRGIGSALLARCEATLRDDGCTRVHEHSGAPVASGDPATAFATARGYRQTQLDLRQDLVLPVDEGLLTALDPAPERPAYVVETSVDGLPEEWLEDRALLARRMSTDAPTGDIELEEEDWDADRVRRQWNTPSPIWAVESVARHVASGRLVGFTDLLVRPGSPRLAVQSDTLVLREHRGHALGLAMKVANLRALARERPEVTTVRTWNAESNTQMVAINERLGFTVSGWTREWAKDL